jgi:anti-anti-sigma factor
MDFQVEPCTVTATEGGFRIVFVGPIHTNTSWLERELDRVVAAKPKDVELDLTGTEYLSSMGLGILVGFHNRIKENGGVVRIVKILKPTLRLFKAAYLDRVFAIEPNAVTEPT